MQPKKERKSTMDADMEVNEEGRHGQRDDGTDGEHVSVYPNKEIQINVARIKRFLKRECHEPLPGYAIRIRDLDDGSTVVTLVVRFKVFQTKTVEEYTMAM